MLILSSYLASLKLTQLSYITYEANYLIHTPIKYTVTRGLRARTVEL
jgi:hypothetical protein